MLMERIILEDKFHDQENAKWTVIRGQLRGHNDAPFRIFGVLVTIYQ
jgi:hypothetical protein